MFLFVDSGIFLAIFEIFLFLFGRIAIFISSPLTYKCCPAGKGTLNGQKGFGGMPGVEAIALVGTGVD